MVLILLARQDAPYHTLVVMVATVWRDIEVLSFGAARNQQLIAV